MELKPRVQLSPLSLWSKQHMRDIFEAPTDKDSLVAIANTFAKDVEATANGMPIGYSDIENMVLALRSTSNGLRVLWTPGKESPDDPSTNCSGSYNGTYIIQGIRRPVPDSEHLAPFERHKTVKVRIEQRERALDSSADGRRIVKLTFVARDVRASRLASL